MADTVRYLLESMVPDLDDLEKRGYFSRAELASVVSQRQEFEYALKRSAARLPDYRRAIAFETSLEELRLARRRARGLAGKKTLADHCIVRRVHFIYQRATRRFRGDLALWGDWLRFCHATGSGRQASRVLTRALALHPRAAALWVHAAGWELEHNADASAARALMQQGLRACRAAPDAARALWHEYFRLELLCAARLRARRALLGIDTARAGGEGSGEEHEGEEERAEDADGAMEAILRGGIARVVLRSALAEVPTDVAFRARFLDVLRDAGEFEGRQELEDEIYAGLAADFPADHRAWTLRALRSVTAGASVAEATQAALEVFEQGLAAAPAPPLFAAALEFLAEQMGAPGADPGLQGAVLAKAQDLCSRAAGAGHASLALLQAWPELHLRLGDLAGAAGVARRAVALMPSASSLQETSIRLLAALVAGDEEGHAGLRGSDSDSDQENPPAGSGRGALAEAALGALLACPRSVTLWLLCIQTLVAHGLPLDDLRRELESVVAAGAKGPTQGGMGTVAAALVRALALTQSLAAAREAYRSLARLPSSGGAFWHALLDIELEASAAGTAGALPSTQMTALFEAAADAHGEEDEELWLRYLQYSNAAGGGGVYWKAVKALRHSDSFVQSCQRLRLA